MSFYRTIFIMECGSTTNTSERRKQVDYTISHFISSARFLVRTDAGIEKLEDLTGKTVTSPKGINLALPMPYLLHDSFKYPSDKVADLIN